MKAIASNHLRVLSAFAFGVAWVLVMTATQAGAFPQTLNAWQDRYGATSASGGNAQCQLCHGNVNGGDPWNGYGWDIRDALVDLACDLNANGVVSNQEAFYCVELDNSDGDGSGYDNATEIGLGTQPGWTNGLFNTLFFKSGLVSINQPPPAGIGALDPDGTEPPPPPPPPPPPGEVGNKKFIQLVKPGESLQEAVDRAKAGGWIFVLPGTYSELDNPTNGLTITQGVNLIGLSSQEQARGVRERGQPEQRHHRGAGGSRQLHGLPHQHGAALPAPRLRRARTQDARADAQQLRDQRLRHQELP